MPASSVYASAGAQEFNLTRRNPELFTFFPTSFSIFATYSLIVSAPLVFEGP